jgi:hypothetical protein
VTAALVMLVAGLAGTYLVRERSLAGSPRLAVAAHLVALVLTWAGVLSAVAHVVAPGEGVVGACGVLLASLWNSSATPGTVAGLAVYALLAVRGTLAAVRTARTVADARRRLLVAGDRRGGHVAVPGLGTVAVTVGLLRPTVVVDRDRFAALTAPEQAVVLEHERGHIRGLHQLVDLLARALSAGLSPWPGARLAHDEIRRHLEAAADDYAARRSSPRRVARAIAVAASGPAPSTLGAAGWHVWRVQRLLDPPRTSVPSCLAAAGGLAGAALVGIQATLHALAGAHLFPLVIVACHTCLS